MAPAVEQWSPVAKRSSGKGVGRTVTVNAHVAVLDAWSVAVTVTKVESRLNQEPGPCE